MTTTIQPDAVVRLLLRAAPARREENFVAIAVRTYFYRIMHASSAKLVAHGLRPVVAPVIAELALNRTASARSFPEFIAKVIDNDAEAAELVLRAVNSYARRLVDTPEQGIESELGSPKFDVRTAAQIVMRNLTYIAPQSQLVH